MIKRFAVILVLLFSVSIVVSAQDEEVVVHDDMLPYKILMESLESNVTMHDSVSVAMVKYLEKNKTRTVTGYRLRIFFDNKQNARSVSGQIAIDFTQLYPDIPVHRVYNNPYWRVTVGNFRSKSEAMKFLNEIKKNYPSVFLVKEAFSTI